MFNIRVWYPDQREKEHWSVMNLSGRTIYKILRRWPEFEKGHATVSNAVHGRNVNYQFRLATISIPRIFTNPAHFNPQQQIILSYHVPRWGHIGATP